MLGFIFTALIYFGVFFSCITCKLILWFIKEQKNKGNENTSPKIYYIKNSTTPKQKCNSKKYTVAIKERMYSAEKGKNQSLDSIFSPSPHNRSR